MIENAQAPSVTATSRCEEEYFRVSNGAATDIPVICGQNSGEHSKLGLKNLIISFNTNWFNCSLCGNWRACLLRLDLPFGAGFFVLPDRPFKLLADQVKPTLLRVREPSALWLSPVVLWPEQRYCKILQLWGWSPPGKSKPKTDDNRANDFFKHFFCNEPNLCETTQYFA